MPLTKIKLPKKTNTQTNSYTGASGEVTIDTDKQVIVVHDGSTAGGISLASEARVNAAFTAANNSTDTWVRSAANAASSYANSAFTRANTSLNSSTGGTVTGDVVITGNLTIQGERTYANTQTVLIADNIITVNAAVNQASAPAFNAGIEVDRGSSANTSLLWNESTDKWTATNDGTNYFNLASDAAESYANSAYTQANTADQRAVTSGSYANSAYLTANSAGSYANAAFAAANSSSGTVTSVAAGTGLTTGAGTTVTGGTALVVNGVNTNYTSVTNLSATQAIATYQGTTGYLNAVILNISGATITSGTVLAVNAVTSIYTSVAVLSATQAIVTYRGASNYLQTCTLNISGSTITAGAILTVNAVTSNEISVTALSTTQALVSYIDATTGYLKAVTLNISGTTVTAGTVLAVNAEYSGASSVATLSATQAIATYTGTSGYLRAVVLNISGTTITAGTVLSFPTLLANGMLGRSVTALSETQAIVTCTNGSTSNYVNAVTLNISGSTITAGTIFAVNNVAGSEDTTITRLSSTQALVAYAGVNDYLQTVVLSVSGTTITAGTILSVNAVVSYRTAITILSATQALVLYSGTSSYLNAILLTVPAVPITTTGTVTLADTAVTAGDYTLASLTVDAQGRITAAANGSSGAAGSYANSAYTQANTADQRAVTSGVYANAAFAAANSSTTVDGIDAVGFRNIPINSQNTAYTAVLADSGKVIFHPSTDANTRTFTIPANSTVAYPNGTAITFINMSTANVTIAITDDTMYSSPDGTTGLPMKLTQYGSATALKMTPTSWLISGSGLSAVVITQGAIFGYGLNVSDTNLSITNKVSTTGVVATNTTGVGTARKNLGAAGYGIDKAIFGYGYSAGNVSMTNLVSNTGVVSADVTGVGTAREQPSAAGYGTDKAIFGYGAFVSMTNLVSNTGVVASDTTGVGTARGKSAAAGYGTDKAIFGYGQLGPGTYAPTSITNLVSNTGVVSTDTAGVGTARQGPAAAGYGTDKAIFGYGYDGTSALSITNLVSNTGVVASNTTGVGTVRYYSAGAGYGTDKAIFAYGTTSGGTAEVTSLSNLISNTGVVANDVTGVGTARYGLAAASFG